MNKENEKILTYAFDKNNRLVHIDTVPNGLKCGCVCPCCRQELIAKKGEFREHHFAHKGNTCAAYYETALHLLAKEIIKEEKAVMLPSYKNLEPKKVSFKEIEIEERRDMSTLQPDCVGITEDGLRIHIEIFVTHKVDERKKEKIANNVINCMEIHIPDDYPLDKDKLTEYIENSEEGRIWINYPYGEEINERIEKEKAEKAAQEKKERARWVMENQADMLKRPSECSLCELYDIRWRYCSHHIEDIEYGGEKYIVCDYKGDEIAPTNGARIKPKNFESTAPVKPLKKKEDISMEEYRRDMNNGVCPLCGSRVLRRNGKYGEYISCINPSCKWTWS